MVVFYYLKYIYNFSDEDVVVGWVENFYWQYLSGMKWFEYEFFINPFSMTWWCNWIGEVGAEVLLKEMLRRFC